MNHPQSAWAAESYKTSVRYMGQHERPISRGCRRYETTISVARWRIMLRHAHALTSSRFISHRRKPHTCIHTRIHTTGPKRPPHNRALSLSFPPPLYRRYPFRMESILFFLFISKSISFCLTFVYPLLSFRKINAPLGPIHIQFLARCIIQMMAECCESP